MISKLLAQAQALFGLVFERQLQAEFEEFVMDNEKEPVGAEGRLDGVDIIRLASIQEVVTVGATVELQMLAYMYHSRGSDLPWSSCDLFLLC